MTVVRKQGSKIWISKQAFKSFEQRQVELPFGKNGSDGCCFWKGIRDHSPMIGRVRYQDD